MIYAKVDFICIKALVSFAEQLCVGNIDSYDEFRLKFTVLNAF